MSSYNIIKDKTGVVQGVWLQDPQKALDRKTICMLLAKGGASSHQLDDVVGGCYRVTPNTQDANGGCFVMLSKE